MLGKFLKFLQCVKKKIKNTGKKKGKEMTFNKFI